jgi:prepilin-type N-terminal cleavage/methylation domain-containing protein
MAHKVSPRPSFGFTVVELIVVIVIVGILISLGAVGYGYIQRDARDKSLISDTIAVESELALYASKNSGTYGDSLQWFSKEAANPNISFTPSRGNVIDVVTSDTAYCIRAYNPAANKRTIDDPVKRSSSSTACNTLVASDAAMIDSSSIPLPVEAVFTANGTWTKPSGAVRVEVLVVGGGGNGAANRSSCGGGGGGGGVSTRSFAASALSSTVAISVAQRGTGSNSQFGTSVVATGGAHGGNCSTPPVGGTGSGTSTKYGNGGNGGNGGSSDLGSYYGQNGLTGGGGLDGYGSNGYPGGNGTRFGGGGGGGGDVYLCTNGGAGGTAGIGSSPGSAGEPGCDGANAAGGDGGNFGGGGGSTSFDGAGTPRGGAGVVKVTTFFQ